MDKKVQDRFEEIERSRFPQFFQMLECNLDLKRWGFQQTFSGIAGHFCPSVIYDSDACRVRFLWYEPDPLGTATVLVWYGRLHASIDHRYMTWNGKKCYCWHDPQMAFLFLDGLSPQEAVKNRFKWPAALEPTNQLLLLEKNSAPEWATKMHSASWESYGQRLFDLFDLRHPEIWEQYTLFLKDCYKLDPHYDTYRQLLEYEIC